MIEDRYEIRIAGSGGQGIIMAALILAEAAGVYDENHVCQTQSYGPEARGGDSKAEVVISKEAIDYPKAIKPDLLLAMNQHACNTYFRDIKPEGLLVADSTLVDKVPTDRVVAIPFTQIAREKAGKGLVANMVALGALSVITQAVSLKGLEAALAARVPRRWKEINREVLHAGVNAARKVDLRALPYSLTPEEEEI